jgi:CxxC motif-containing protein (DUF1111 family)
MFMLQPRGRLAVPILVVSLLAVSSVFATIVYGAIGDPIVNLKPQESKFFANGKPQFNRVWGMQEGVGPVLTDGGCLRCHNQPVLGGSSTRILTFFGKTNPDGSFDPLDGTGASGVNEGGLLLQPRSNQAFLPNCSQGGEVVPLDANSIENRSAPPVFGLGLIDAIDDATITAQATFELNNYAADGIHGIANTVGRQINYPNAPNQIGRFGRKAQMANLVEMAAFAFAHDLGITNPIFPTEDLPQGQPIDPNCTQDTAFPNNNNTTSGGKGIFELSHFIRFLAPAVPTACPNGDCGQGQTVFTTIGCNECHLPSYTTKAGYRTPTDMAGTTLPSVVLSSQSISLYSDLLLHDLGNSDKGVIPAGYPNTGIASVSQWRTTPLWGLQYRTKFMHSGTAGSLDAAILAHSDSKTGEAITVINRYKGLSASDHQALLDFLASL